MTRWGATGDDFGGRGMFGGGKWVNRDNWENSVIANVMGPSYESKDQQMSDQKGSIAECFSIGRQEPRSDVIFPA